MLGDLSHDEFLSWAREAGFAELAELMLWRWDPGDRADDFPESAGWYGGEAQTTLYGLRAGDDRDRFVRRIRANAIDDTEPAYSDEALVALYERVERWLKISIPRWRHRRDLAALRELPFHFFLGEDPAPEAAVSAVVAICRESGVGTLEPVPERDGKPVGGPVDLDDLAAALLDDEGWWLWRDPESRLYVALGYDFNLWVGSHVTCAAALEQARGLGLDPEVVGVSPYLYTD